MSTNYHDTELDLATTACEKNAPLFQSTGNRFDRRDAEGALWLLKELGDSADKRSAIRDLALVRYSSDFAEPGQDVLLTGASHSGAPTQYPTCFVHGTGGDYGHDLGNGSYDEGEYGEGLHGDDGPCMCYFDGGDASQGLPVGPPRATNATGPQPGRRDGPTPCWNERSNRLHDPGATSALCSAC